MAEDSESAASQQSLELDDQDTCGIDGDNEEEAEHAKGIQLFQCRSFKTSRGRWNCSLHAKAQQRILMRLLNVNTSFGIHNLYQNLLKELYTLLNENYVEDDDNMFRFDYSPEFLLWALRPPGWLPQWHCGVRVSSNKKLVGFISAIPANIRIYDSVKKMVEINFLCVHKKLRSKRVAPVLIREITRRVNLEGIFQAVYTAGVVLPKPVATCRYWHRSLNPRKLVEVKFSHLSRNMTLQRTMKLYRLPDATKTSGLRPMEQKDTNAVQELINTYLKQFNLAPVMDEAEVAHWFLPRDHIIDTYVVEGSNGILTDFLSFYTLPSTVMHHPVHKSLKAAYSFYNIHTETPLLDLMNDALIIAKLKGFDVFNALDLMENKTFLEKLKFGIGDGNLQYYLYNWRCPGMESEKVGLVLQ
ncbi:glycylpeptide N-tetradecanoyltransferase 2 isoform X4 [Calypte anna]|uniref:glycylpeptide N-tetradecanoyltransferase 2 isoform X4 n=1 Tax=Calypte anna TaxID=9244 RepID=UPI0011C38021|nr:glycylpeptide N-tetradecanoyltransferase 2 isoform X4 [Calypte anna]